MAVRDDFTAGEVLAAADLNDTFGAKLDLAGGKVLQVVRATDATFRNTTSASYVDVTGMSVTITPQRSTSAVLLLAIFYGSVLNNTAGTSSEGRVQLTDSSNNAISGAEDMQLALSATNPTNLLVGVPFTLIGYATPATTSAVTFKMRMKVTTASSIRIENQINIGQIYAIEVSA
jgi:hypothetical protein